MALAALIIGIFGAVAGFVGGVFALFVGGVAGAFGAEEAGIVVGGGLAAIGFSIVGLVGAALSMAKPRAAGTLMLVSAIGGLIAVSVAYSIATILLLIAALLTLLGPRHKTSAGGQ